MNDEFLGWLEFQATEPNDGVAWSDDWPRDARVELIVPASELGPWFIYRVTGTFPKPFHGRGGDWVPLFHTPRGSPDTQSE